MKSANRHATRWLATGVLLALPGCIFSSRAFSAPASSGADVFKTKCAMCHGPDGSGNTPMGQRFKIHDLRSSEVQSQTDDQLTTIITNGKPPMPAYGKTLTSGDIQQLVAYIRSIKANS